MSVADQSANRLPRLSTWSLLLLLLGAGLAGNYFAYELFFDVRFVFGSIFALLALQLFGLGGGVLVAAASASITYPLWNHPYVIVIAVAEVGAVGLLTLRLRQRFVVAATIFWLGLGMPLVYLFYHLVMELPRNQVFVVALNQGVNGIANALVARLLFMAVAGYLPKVRFSLREVLFKLLALAILFSSLLLFVGQSWDRVAELDRATRSSLLLGQERVAANLVKWLESRMGVVGYLARQAAGEAVPRMQEILAQAQGMESDFLRLVLVDRQANSVAGAPLHDEFGQLIIGKNYADRPFLPLLQARRLPMFSEVLLSKVGKREPTVILLTPVLRGEEYAGFLAGILNLAVLGEQIALNSRGQLVAGVNYTLVDNKNQVIISSRPEAQVMAPYSRGAGSLTALGDGVWQWRPLQRRNVATSERWKESLYITETAIGALAEWKLILELPLAPMLEKLYDEFTLRLAEVLGLFLGALVLASFASRKVIVALEELMVSTSLMPSKLLGQEAVVWPESNILEIERLIGNYRQMAQALALQFQEIRKLNLGLEEVVAARTTELRESEGRFRALFARLRTLVDNLQVGVILEDEERKILAVNRRLGEMFAIPLVPEALAGGDGRNLAREFARLFVDPERFLARIEELVARREVARNEEWPLADGRVLERDYEPVAIGGQDRGSLWNYRDVTIRKERERQLHQSLREKETLLREVHHRVKNNMAVISSLLALQAGKIEDEGLRIVFAESQQRVKSLALIHEKLYRAADVAHIDFGDYLRLLVQELLSFHHRSGEAITATVEAETMILDIDTAIPCGLIVNELLTNALKYAFPPGRGGEIVILFRRLEQRYILTVRDNGIGLPAGFDYQEAGSLGLQLVEALTAQIRGSWQLSSNGGTEVVITFQGKGE